MPRPSSRRPAGRLDEGRITRPIPQGITRITVSMALASSLLPMATQYTAEGRRLLGLHGTNGRAVRIGAVDGDGELVDECDVAARSWVIFWTAADGEIVERSYDSHNRACVIAGVLEGTR